MQLTTAPPESEYKRYLSRNNPIPPMSTHQDDPKKEQQQAETHREEQPQSDVQGNEKASVNPFTRTGGHKTQEQNPSRNPASQSAPMGRDSGKNAQKRAPQRSNPQGNNPMSKDV